MARIDIEGLTMKNISPPGGAQVDKFKFSSSCVHKICVVYKILTKGIMIFLCILKQNLY